MLWQHTEYIGYIIVIWLLIASLAYWNQDRAIASMVFGVRWTLVGIAVGIGSALYQEAASSVKQIYLISLIILTLAVMQYLLLRSEGKPVSND